ncbi:MAG: hypothetical protein LBQ75_08110 [Zoogloeaceae bacterium]|jgi:hypothetical protein|nr:hypothetical protein [Zoogloeaceae bacterium]
MSRTPYETLESVLAEIRQRGEAGDWASASAAFDQLHLQIQGGQIPQATATDRAALERAKAHLDSIAERAIPLHKDMETLLKAFGGTGKPAA